MRVKIIAVYKFEELPLSVQTKVIDRYRDRLSDLLNDDLKEAMNWKLNNCVGSLDFELAYSLNCCQGDGTDYNI